MTPRRSCRPAGWRAWTRRVTSSWNGPARATPRRRRERGGPMIDAVTLELVKNAVESVVDEMALTIMRTAYSSNLKSSNDLSSAYCSLDGELLAQGFTLPMQLGSIPDAMAAVLAKVGGRLEPGDCRILKDRKSVETGKSVD